MEWPVSCRPPASMLFALWGCSMGGSPKDRCPTARLLIERPWHDYSDRALLVVDEGSGRLESAELRISGGCQGGYRAVHPPLVGGYRQPAAKPSREPPECGGLSEPPVGGQGTARRTPDGTLHDFEAAATADEGKIRPQELRVEGLAAATADEARYRSTFLAGCSGRARRTQLGSSWRREMPR